MTQPNRIIRNRPLSPDEAAKYRAIREQIELEKPEIAERLRSGAPGPGSWDDLYELRCIVQSLRGERERQGISRDELARRAAVEPKLIEDFEEGRELNPPLAILSRYADAVGRHLMMGLSAGTLAPPLPPIEIAARLAEQAHS